MATIQIQHIGALTDTGEVFVKRVTLILGPQGVGKSTLMKILCYCRWVEKVIMKDPKTLSQYRTEDYFIEELRSFYRFDKSFFSEQSHIIYKGDILEIDWSQLGGCSITLYRKGEKERLRHTPKIAFLPAERNLISAVPNVDKSYRSNVRDVLFNFIFEFDEAKQGYDAEHKLSLSVSPHLFYYNQQGADLIWHEQQEISMEAFYAASGIQSAFPIDVFSAYLYKQVGERYTISLHEVVSLLKGFFPNRQPTEYTGEELSQALDGVPLVYSSMQLYIEEPEQNLFPASQRDLTLRLLQMMSTVKKKEIDAEPKPHPSSLVFTTHSPYILSVINTQLAVVRARMDLLDNSEGLSGEEQKKRLAELEALQKKYKLDDIDLTSDEYAAYFVEEDGTLKNLIDSDFPMVSGVDLDGVSDWVEDYTNEVYQIAYGR
ncbi:AAA family ATPase [uncultured Porphyromonas sp.]|uniref:AAA family ATPase n=1 Tax=uncultured Porphyromonas sp. TaxID=159274 RepID=UPI002619EFBD|nr:AAA family ATPase [uncultured Porphyromonas sp.]